MELIDQLFRKGHSIKPINLGQIEIRIAFFTINFCEYE